MQLFPLFMAENTHLNRIRCNYNNNILIMVKYYVPDFTCLLMVLYVAGLNPLYT